MKRRAIFITSFFFKYKKYRVIFGIMSIGIIDQIFGSDKCFKNIAPRHTIQLCAFENLSIACAVSESE